MKDFKTSMRARSLCMTAFFLSMVLAIICFIEFLLENPERIGFYEKDHYDVVFFGPSASYSAFSPTIMDEYGYDSYNRGRQQQPTGYSYYTMRDAFDELDIDTVVFEIGTMHYNEDFIQLYDTEVIDSSLGGLSMKNRFYIIRDCVPLELKLQYLPMFLKSHENWKCWNLEWMLEKIGMIDAKYVEEAHTDRGFVEFTDVVPYVFDEKQVAFSEERIEIYENNLFWLEQIYELCKEHEANLVLVKNPIPCNETIVGIANSVADWSDEHDVSFINYMRMYDELGLDLETDTMDGGGHLNIGGAEKVSRNFGTWLKSNGY